jgi:uncharacterized damage-inducible protein DinB
MEIVTIGPFLDYFERLRGRTTRVIACIPADRLDWTYREGKFTFADLIRHLGAIERWMFAENVAGRPSRYPGHVAEVAAGFSDPAEYLKEMHAQSMAIFGALTDADLRERCTTPGGASIPIWKWLRSMTEHEIHHRGQIYLYLSMLEIETPPLYGLTSEQVRERSSG